VTTVPEGTPSTLATTVDGPFQSSLRAWCWRYVLALVLASLLTAAGLLGGSWYLDHKFESAKDVSLRLSQGPPANFLILGSDSRAFVEDPQDEASFGGTHLVGGQRADAIIVARVEPRARRGLLVSFPRDLLVRQRGQGTRRINEAFERGPQGVIDVLRDNFDIPIHHYLEVDFAGFRTMVDAIGGVRMHIPAPVRDRLTGLDVKTAGCVVFDGAQALAWVRSRHFTYLEDGKWRSDPTGDLGRIQRQQEFIRRLMSRAISAGALNPIRANNLANVALANLKVDDTLHVRDALRLVRAFRSVAPGAVEMLALPTQPAGQLLRPAPAAKAVVTRLRGQTPATVPVPSPAASALPAPAPRPSAPPASLPKAAC
jgi:LCP family protein required for cell wall assembly